jgi:hypothetical protein
MNAKTICRRVLNSRAVKRTKRILRDHGADIFSVLAGIGVIATGVTAYNAGRNAEIGESSDSEGMRKVHNLLVPVSLGTATIGCIYGARHYGKLKEESLLAACSALAVYARRKDQTSNRECEEESDRTDIEDTGTGDVIFIEDFTGRRFKASWECYEYAKRKLQENFSVAQCVTLNDFYGLLNLSETSAGEVLGWTIDQMIMDPFYDGKNMLYEDALTQICIEEDTDEDGNVIIYYCVLPIGSLAGIGPCNY